MKTKDESIMIDSLYIRSEIKDILKKYGIKTLNDLTLFKKEDIEIFFKRNYEFEMIIGNLHKNGLIFDGEFNELEIPLEEAIIKVDDMKIPSLVKAFLRKMDLYMLGDILKTDYEVFLKTRHIGETKIELLKECMHELGYKLLNEENPIEAILKSKKQNGETLCEEYKDSNVENTKTINILYQHKIYSVEDLIESRKKINAIRGLGPAKIEEIKKIVKTYQKQNDKNFNDQKTKEEKIQELKELKAEIKKLQKKPAKKMSLEK